MKFIVEGKPQGKARARTFYNRQRGKMQSMTPQNTVDYENLVRWSYKAAELHYRLAELEDKIETGKLVELSEETK